MKKERGKKEANNNKTTHTVKNGKQKKDKSVVTEEAQPEITIAEHSAMKGVEQSVGSELHMMSTIRL